MIPAGSSGGPKKKMKIVAGASPVETVILLSTLFSMARHQTDTLCPKKEQSSLDAAAAVKISCPDDKFSTRYIFCTFPIRRYDSEGTF